MIRKIALAAIGATAFCGMVLGLILIDRATGLFDPGDMGTPTQMVKP